MASGNDRAAAQPWVAVVRSDDVTGGAVVAAAVGDVDLVVWRTAQGAAVVTNARCPHAFSHLAAVGEVDGDELVCRVHCWRFDADGASWVGGRWYREPRPPLGAYPSRESDGWVQVRVP